MLTSSLTNDMLALLLSIERSRERFNGVKLPRSLSNRLRKSSMKKSSYASNRIEGNPLTEEQASAAIDATSRHFLKPEQEIRNYYEALGFLEKELGKKSPFSRKLLLDVQRIVVKGESAEKTGIRGPMPPGVLFAVYDDKTGRPEYIPPECTDIGPLLEKLEEYIRSSNDHPVVKAAVVHYELVTIHPFEDGNGRTARLMSDYMLDLGGYGFGQIGSLEEYFAYDIDEYYKSLQMGLPPLYYDGRANPPRPEIWLTYFLRMVDLHAQKVVELVGSAADKREEASLSHLNAKERILLEYLQKKKLRVIRPADVAKAFGVTNRTAVNWCVGLAENGFLEPNLSGQRILSYSLAK